MKYSRILEIERGALDLETGSFPMVLATEGEASDGHILSIKGGSVPERMPLLFGHRSEPQIPSLGSVTGGSKGSKGGVAVLRATGTINLNGDDPLAATRRGIAQLVADGDLHAVSIRWDGTKATRRTQLPKSHKFHVSESDETEARWGMLFEEWNAREGSIVAIGADPAALIGRAQASDDELEQLFFRVLGEQSPNQEGLLDTSSAVRLVDVRTEHLGEVLQVPIAQSVYDSIWNECCESLRATDDLSPDGEEEDGDAGRRDENGSDGVRDEEPVVEQAVFRTRTIGDLTPEEFQRMSVDALQGPLAKLVENLTGRRNSK